MTLLNICMDYSYYYGIMTQDQGPHPRHTECDEMETHHKSLGHVTFLAPDYHW